MRTAIRRARRRAIAALGVGALSAAALLPQAALAEAEPELLGDPVPYLIESLSAPGKVLEIGNAGAQLTLPDNTRAAAAVFPFAGTADALRAQTVLAYPVEGSADAFVLANSAGDVLARRGNDDSNFRYLELPGLSLDQAAADPAAQWTMSDAGGGFSYLRNANPYPSGLVAGLDMYNWKTATGSEVQSYDAGSANVQKWRLHRLVADVATYEARVDTGAGPRLPPSLTAK